MLRAIPGLVTIRPSDANEVPLAWKAAIERRDGPTAIVTTRQNLPVFDRSKTAPAEGLLKGGYVLKDAEGGKPQIVLMATGSEVQYALGAQELLAKDRIRARVVAMPAFELFDAQSESYRNSVLPPDVRARVAVEAAHPMSWSKYVGLDGAYVCLPHYGASAPFKTLYEKFGFTASNVAEVAKKTLK